MTAPIIAVVDRTGVLHDAVREVRRALLPLPEVLDVRHTDFDLGGVRAEVLVLGTRELSNAGLKRVLRWTQQHPGAAVLAHLPAKGAAAPDVATLRAHGVTAWFRGDPSGQRLVPLLRAALPGSAVPDATAAPDVSDVAAELPESEAGSRHSRATVVTVCSASGGCGKTFLATNLAAAAATAARRVLLLDLDLQFGEVGAALQLRHPYSVLDGLYDAHGTALEEAALVDHLDELVHHSPLGFDVLLAPRDPALADLVTPHDVERVLAAVVPYYDVVLVDTAPVLNEVSLAALDASDVVTVVAALDVPSLRNLTSYLEVLDRLGLEAVRQLVLNKVDSDVGIDLGQVKKVFGGRFVAHLPADKAASRSLNTGTVVVRSEPRSAVAKALVAAARAILPPGDTPAAAPVARAGIRLRALRHIPSTTPGGTP